MPPSNLQHRRTHNLLLISKLLNQRDTTSPFTLLLDSLEQSARPLIDEYIRRAKLANLRIIFVSFSTLRRPHDVDIFLPAWKHDVDVSTWHSEVLATLRTPAKDNQKKTLLIIDSLHPLSSTSPSLLPQLLSSLLSPTTSLLAVYHTDIPLPPPSPASSYAPSPLTLLRYLATTLLTTHNLAHVLAARRARERSLVAPSFGLREGVEGVLQGLAAQEPRNGSAEGVVLELEHRRKSGRGVTEWFFLPLLPQSSAAAASAASGSGGISLLEDHALYASPALGREGEGGEDAERTTFSLGLTERQRRDREGVVLPYFDAQKGAGAGEGGRILYDLGSEDDFDEEEDEI